jgi:hypothetical protein
MIKTLSLHILKHLAYATFVIFFCALAKAQTDSNVITPKATTHERGYNFAMLYAGQWAYYLVVQREEIEKYGSIDNWLKNPIDPHYDRDSFDYNLYRHTLAGNYYYLYYRSRGYSEQNAFLWSTLSSLAFEFTIETATERPSYQDMYQTPVYGTVLGVGVEKLSIYLHDTDTWYGHTLGYILNPFTLIPQTDELFGIIQLQPNNELALRVGWEFE